jgi:hypothetical protein
MDSRQNHRSQPDKKKGWEGVVTVKGTNAKGQTVNNGGVYEKHGEPRTGNCLLLRAAVYPAAGALGSAQERRRSPVFVRPQRKPRCRGAMLDEV